MSRRVTWVGVAVLFCVVACANVWNFRDLQIGVDGGDMSDSSMPTDATVADAGDASVFDAAASDSSAGDAAIGDAPGERGPTDGACQDACPAGMGCDNGSCVCQGQPNQCGSQCVDLLSDPGHCGTCLTVCASGAACNAGLCACPSAAPNACGKIGSDAGVCVDTLTDHSHCGSCSNACATTSACHNGSCTVCGTLTTDRQCDGGVCVDTASDPLNCGACGHVCPVGAKCVSSSCTCLGGLRVCGSIPGACTDVTNGDPKNCGACAHVCTLAHASASCSASSCIIFKCNPGYTDCDLVPSNGCEVHTAGDPANCGSCRHVCALPHAAPFCSADTCVVNTCNPGYANCDSLNANGCEVHTDADVNNCGSCGHVCPVPAGGSATCVGGVCGGTCTTPGATACPVVNPTACVNLPSDNANCGMCGRSCATPSGSSCVSGTCTCPSVTPAVCSATCVSLLSDPNCGSCAYNCAMMTGGTCVAGTCIAPLFDAGIDTGAD